MPQTYGVISPRTMNPETVLQFTAIRKSIHTTLRKALPHRMGQNEPLPIWTPKWTHNTFHKAYFLQIPTMRKITGDAALKCLALHGIYLLYVPFQMQVHTLSCLPIVPFHMFSSKSQESIHAHIEAPFRILKRNRENCYNIKQTHQNPWSWLINGKGKGCPPPDCSNSSDWL